jgi:hypothetical protein
MRVWIGRFLKEIWQSRKGLGKKKRVFFTAHDWVIAGRPVAIL